MTPQHHIFSFPPPGWPSNTLSNLMPINTTIHPPPSVNNSYVNPAHHNHYPHQPSFHQSPQIHVHSHPHSRQHTHPHAQYPYIPIPNSSLPPPQPNQPYYLPTSNESQYVPKTAYAPPLGNFRPSYVPAPAPTPTRSTHSQYTPAQLYGSQSRQSQLQPNGAVPSPSAGVRTNAPAVYYHPQSYAPGPLGFFLPPPGQPTTDPSLTTSPTSQANYTTYPSRLRTGITDLIQPERVTGGKREREAYYADLDRDYASGRAGSGASTPRYDSPHPGGGGGGRRAAAAAAAASGRRGRVVNYAEKASDDDDDDVDDDEDSDLSDPDEPASDPEDNSYGNRSGRKPGRPRLNRDRESSMMTGGKSRRRREEVDKGWTWLGDRVPGDKVKSQRKERTAHQYVSEELLEAAANRPDLIVPITVDLEVSSGDPNVQGIRIKDRFLWNMSEPFIDPKSFSEIFCKDIGIPVQSHAETIESLIKAQLEEAQNTVEIDIQDEEVTEEDVTWSDEDESEVEDVMQVDTPNGDHVRGPSAGPDVNGKAHYEEKEKVNGDIEADADADEVEEAEAEEKEKVWEEADCRIIVNLDVQIYTHILRDRIEWDLSSTLPPAIFAQHYCSELGLTGEAIPLIAFAIHEELLKHKKDALELELFAASHPEQQAKFDAFVGTGAGGGGGRSGIAPKTNYNSKRGLKGLKGVWRDWFERDDFSPVLVELSFEEMAAREQERTREARRMIRALAGNKRRR